MPHHTDDTRLVTVLFVVVGAFVVFPMVFMSVGMMGFGPTMGGMWGAGTMPGWMLVVSVVTQLPFVLALVGGGYLVYRTVAGRADDSDRET